MLPEGITVQDYNERRIADFYLGSNSYYVFASPGITGAEFTKQNGHVVKALTRIFEDAKQAATDKDTDRFERYIGLLRQFGPKRRLEGVDDLVTGLREYMATKPISLGDFYQYAL